jgi:hypothetical protein
VTTHTPLRSLDDAEPYHASLDGELRLARALLDELASANIHDHHEMVKAAVSLDCRLRSLLAALDTERGTR